LVEFQHQNLLADGGDGESAQHVRTYVIHPDLPGRKKPHDRSAEDRLDEACGLARAIELNIVDRSIVHIKRMRPATLFGKGKVEEFAGYMAALNIDLAIVDGSLSPVQQRNLEREWKIKVLDRAGLILEIFSARARTREGRLQVELAHLTYQKSRLVRSWTHLERQRGGLGFVGGPGETQIEADRRLIDERIVKLKRQLETVVSTRELQRAGRRRVPYPIVAIVGYTNAGKSTLFNRLTNAEVFAENLLFATLDPTMRELALPGGKKIILSDTVGFISDLPTDLIAAFRATLEEVLEADVILHVSDVSGAHAQAEREDVHAVLKQLGIDESSTCIIEAMNKIDLLGEEDRDRVISLTGLSESSVAVSATSGEGLDELLTLIERNLARGDLIVAYEIGSENGRAMSWLHQHARIIERDNGEETSRFLVEITPANLGRAEKELGIAPVDEIEEKAAE